MNPKQKIPEQVSKNSKTVSSILIEKDKKCFFFFKHSRSITTDCYTTGWGMLIFSQRSPPGCRHSWGWQTPVWASWAARGGASTWTDATWTPESREQREANQLTAGRVLIIAAAHGAQLRKKNNKKTGTICFFLLLSDSHLIPSYSPAAWKKSAFSCGPNSSWSSRV